MPEADTANRAGSCLAKAFIEQPRQIVCDPLMRNCGRYHHDGDAFDQFPAFMVRTGLLERPEFCARHRTGGGKGGSYRHGDLQTSSNSILAPNIAGALRVLACGAEIHFSRKLLLHDSFAMIS